MTKRKSFNAFGMAMVDGRELSVTLFTFAGQGKMVKRVDVYPVSDEGWKFTIAIGIEDIENPASQIQIGIPSSEDYGNYLVWIELEKLLRESAAKLLKSGDS